MSSISSINSLPSLDQITGPLTAGTGTGSSEFSKILQSAVNQVENSHASATTAIQNFLSGENGELHSTILATQKAELQFELFMQARNKVVSAYQEIMKMQV
jgi:flagellar hook-basal body complex protein FliE